MAIVSTQQRQTGIRLTGGHPRLVCLVVLWACFVPGRAWAVNRLFLGDPAGPVASGQIFAVPVFLDTDGSSVLAADLNISFPPAGLEVLGLDPAGSVFDNAAFDNPLLVSVDPVAGTAEVISGAPAPGVSGLGLPLGYLIVRSLGPAGSFPLQLRFTSAGTAGESHLPAADGLGTDVLAQVAGVNVGVGSQTASDALFAHFVQGGGFATTVTLVNPHAGGTAAGVLVARDAAGQPLDFKLGGVARRGYAAVVIGPQQALQWQALDSGPLISGTIAVSSNISLDGEVLFDSSVGTAGVGMSAPVTRLMAPVERDLAGGVNSGLALQNPSGQTRTCPLVLRLPSGQMVRQTVVTLPPHGQKVGFLNDFFPDYDTSRFSGSITGEPAEPVAAMVIRTGVDSGGSFATMPVVTSGEMSLIFAHFADGAGIRSLIMLLNPSPSAAASGSVRLSGQDGAPLGVDINGQVVGGGFDFSLPPLGLGVYATDGAGPLVAGNVRITSAQPVGGTVLFTGPAGTDGVGASRPGTRFLAPVEIDAASEVNTGLSLANAGTAPVQLHLQLLGLGGEHLADSPIISLPTDGNYVRFLDGLFPGYAFPPGFHGLVKLVAPQPVAAMALRAGPGSFSALPVIPIE